MYVLSVQLSQCCYIYVLFLQEQIKVIIINGVVTSLLFLKEQLKGIIIIIIK
jgi:hypothetical protein